MLLTIWVSVNVALPEAMYSTPPFYEEPVTLLAVIVKPRIVSVEASL